MTHKQKVLRLLSDHRPHSHHELYQLGCVAHSRISDLRRDGHRIEQWRDGDLYLYQLKGVLDEPLAEASGRGSSSAPSIPTPSSPEPNDDEPHHGSRGGGVLTLFGDPA